MSAKTDSWTPTTIPKLDVKKQSTKRNAALSVLAPTFQMTLIGATGAEIRGRNATQIRTAANAGLLLTRQTVLFRAVVRLAGGMTPAIAKSARTNITLTECVNVLKAPFG